MSEGPRRGGPSPGFAVWELGPGAGAGRVHTVTGGPVYPGIRRPDKGRGKRVPQGLLTGGAIWPRTFPPPSLGPRHPSSSGPTQASATPGGAGRWPQRTLLKSAHLLFSDGAATTEPGARAVRLRWAGTNRTRQWLSQHDVISAAHASKPSAANPEDLCPAASYWESLKSG